MAQKINREDCVTDSARARDTPVQDELAKSQEQNSKGNKSKGKDQPKDTPEPESKPGTAMSTNEEALLWAQNPKLHWSDVAMKVNKYRVVDLEEQI